MIRFKIIIKILKEIYPLYILLLIFSPIIVGVFFNFDSFDSRAIAINLAWIPLFTLPSIFSKKELLIYSLSQYFL